jgi:glycogen synthase
MEEARQTFQSEPSLDILMVAARFTPYVGGTETHTQEVASRLVKQGNSVTVLTTDPTGNLPQHETIDGVTVERVPAYPRSRDYYFAPRIYQKIRNGSWDLVHCQGYHSFVCPMAATAARRAGIPYVISFHSGGHSSSLRVALRGIQRRLLRPIIAGADRLIAVSPFEVDLFGTSLGIPESKFAVIPNGSNLIMPTGIPEESANGSHHRPLILSIGRLERYKGHQRAIKAMPFLLKKLSDARLMVVGSGPFEPELIELVHEMGLTESVSVGSIPSDQRDQMARLIASASLVTLLSDYEAHPVSVVESLALGRPVLVLHAAGCAELADQGLVRSIPKESTDQEIAEAMRQQIEDPLIPQSVEIPDWDSCVSELVRVYRDIVPTVMSGRKLLVENSGIT